MNRTKLLLAFGCLLALVTSAFTQNTQTRRTFGYVDSRTGIFHPLNRTPLSEEAAASITPTTGTFVFNVTITVSSALPTNAVITCGVGGGVDDLLTGDFSNDVQITAKRSGSTATCTVNVPYSWDLGEPTKDTVEMDLTVEATAGTSGSTGFYDEIFIAPAITMAVPKTGTTTTKDITTTI
jgi:hypothetical protein